MWILHAWAGRYVALPRRVHAAKIWSGPVPAAAMRASEFEAILGEYQGPTKRVHVYARQTSLETEGYGPVW